jgi:hypothetical protein
MVRHYRKKYVPPVTLALRYSMGLFLGFVPQPKLPLSLLNLNSIDADFHYP